MHYQTDIMELFPSVAPALLSNTRQLCDAARHAGVAVYFAKIHFSPGYPEVSPLNKNGQGIKQLGLFVHDRISPELGQRDDEPLIIAHRASVFYGTDLQVRLSAQGIDTLILVGVASTGVMLSTIAHASDADYRLYSVKDCCYDRTRWYMNTCSPPPSNRAPRCCRWRTPWRCCADRPWPARTASPPETRMETIEGQTFLMSYDKGGSHFHDLHLRDCTFDNGALSMVKHPKRMSRVRNLRLSQCSAINSMIKPCVFEDVLVEDLSTNPILLVWASFFRRVTLRGKIGKINLNLVPEAFCTDAAILDQFSAGARRVLCRDRLGAGHQRGQAAGAALRGRAAASDPARSADAGHSGQAGPVSRAAGAGPGLRTGVSRDGQRAARFR